MTIPNPTISFQRDLIHYNEFRSNRNSLLHISDGPLQDDQIHQHTLASLDGFR